MRAARARRPTALTIVHMSPRNGRRALGVTMLVLLGALLGCGKRLPAPAYGTTTLPAPREQLRRVPLGLCEDYPEETRSLAEARRDFAVLAAAHVNVLRVSMGWDGLEPSRDHYDFGF